MAISITYGILFEVQILHHYFLNRGMKNYARMPASEQAEAMLQYDARNLFTIIPTSQCQHDLERHGCFMRQTATGLIVGAKTALASQNPNKYTPCIPLDNDLVFTFHLQLNDLALLNYTALSLTATAGQVYLFGNRQGTQAKIFPSLAALPATFQNGRLYLPGDMVVDHATSPTTLYTARLKTGAAPAGSADWLEEKTSDNLPMSYAGENDRLVLVRQQLRYRVKTAEVEPQLVITTAAGTVIEAKAEILPGQFRTVLVDLRGLPEGRYTLQAQSSDLTYQDTFGFYLLQQQTPPFGILELGVTSDAAGYGLLDPQGQLLSPAYELRFKNRATHWRYIGKNFNTSSVTSDPLPLTRFGAIDNVSVVGKDGTLFDDLPGPEVTMIKAEALTIEAEKKFYSEIHIH